MSLKKNLKKVLIKLFGLENFIYYKSLVKFKILKTWDKDIDDFYFFLNLLKPDCNVMDIGANVGMMTILLSRKLSPGKVFSFEPVRVTYNVLEKMVRHYKLKNVTLYNLAVGNENKKVTMHMPVFTDFISDMGSYVMRGEYHYNNPNVMRFDVEQVTLDSMNEFRDIRIDAIKLDVENYEYFALSGAKSFINIKRPLIYSELWSGTENQNNVFKLMEELKYEKFIYKDNTLKPYDPSYNRLNYFFIPVEKIPQYVLPD